MFHDSFSTVPIFENSLKVLEHTKNIIFLSKINQLKIEIKMNDQETDKKLRITLKPFNLPTDRHYVKVGDDVIKFQSEFCRTDGSHLPA